MTWLEQEEFGGLEYRSFRHQGTGAQNSQWELKPKRRCVNGQRLCLTQKKKEKLSWLLPISSQCLPPAASIQKPEGKGSWRMQYAEIKCPEIRIRGGKEQRLDWGKQPSD